MKYYKDIIYYFTIWSEWWKENSSLKVNWVRNQRFYLLNKIRKSITFQKKSTELSWVSIIIVVVYIIFLSLSYKIFRFNSIIYNLYNVYAWVLKGEFTLFDIDVFIFLPHRILDHDGRTCNNQNSRQGPLNL